MYICIRTVYSYFTIRRWRQAIARASFSNFKQFVGSRRPAGGGRGWELWNSRTPRDLTPAVRGRNSLAAPGFGCRCESDKNGRAGRRSRRKSPCLCSATAVTYIYYNLSAVWKEDKNTRAPDPWVPTRAHTVPPQPASLVSLARTRA